MVTVALCLFTIAFIGPTSVAAQPPGLFLPGEKPAATLPLRDPTAIRSRYVTIDVEQLTKQNADGSHRPTLLLNLFPDASYEAVLDRVDRIGDSLVWVGHIPNTDSSSVTISLEDRTVYGRIAVGEAAYIVRLVQEEVHAIIQIDSSAFAPERPPISK